MKYKLINYHCRHCGAPVEPGQEKCSYCDQIAKYQKFIDGKNKPLTLLIDTDNDFVNFNEITRMKSVGSEPEYIEATSLCDTSRRFIRSGSTDSGKIWFEIPYTERGSELIGKLLPKVYRMRFELNGTSKAYETKAYIGNVEPIIAMNSIAVAKITLIRDDDLKMLEVEQPRGLSCPNCGAPIISRYGACGYCGGWLEYVS